MVKVLDSQSRGPKFKIAGWLKGQLSFSSFQGWLNEYQEWGGVGDWVVKSKISIKGEEGGMGGGGGGGA